MRKVPIDPVPQFVGENQKIGHSLDEGQPRHVAGPSYFDWRRCAAVIRDKPVVAVIWTWALLLSGCGGPTGKGMYKDRDRPLPEAEASPHDSLTASEVRIRELVRQVYGQHIVKETIAHSGGDAVLKLGLRDEKISSLDINLSSLARQFGAEGPTLAALKAALNFDHEADQAK
jgi:hypothetical protein